MNGNVNIRNAEHKDLEQLSEMACMLFKSDKKEITEEFVELLKSQKSIIYIAVDDDKVVAFAQFELRYDYVEGTNTSPVGYIEGIYVQKEYRNIGLASQLVKRGEQWAKQKGCTQMASDCELSNIDSYKFHTRIGYEETNKIVCFKKDI